MRSPSSDDNGRPRAVRTLARQPAPAGIWASSFDEDLAVTICLRLANGESLRSICRNDPTMPTEKTVWNWTQRHGWFAELKAWAVGHARRTALAEQRRRDEARFAAKAARRLARGEPAEPITGYCEGMAREICGLLVEGWSLTRICRRADMPCIATVYYWMRRRPEFLDDYRHARRMQAELVYERAAEAAAGVRKMRALKAIMRAADVEVARLAPTRLAEVDPDAPRELALCGPVAGAQAR